MHCMMVATSWMFGCCTMWRPHVSQHFPAQFALTLALPIIWAWCYNEQLTIPVPDFLKNRVWQAYYKQIWDPNNLPAEQNPIEKQQQLVVINDNGALLINASGRLANANNQQNNNTNGITLQLEQELWKVHAQLAECHALCVSQVHANRQRDKEAWQRIVFLHWTLEHIKCSHSAICCISYCVLLSN